MTEAELVLTHVLNCDRLSLYLHKETRLAKNESVAVAEIFRRRLTGEPLQYILGSTEFMGYEFKVDRRALIPRPETEILVSSALEQLKSIAKAAPKILDLGTGSGCIAVSIAKLLPSARIWAADVSGKALQLAKENADLHKVKIKFLRSDIFNAFKKDPEKFDLIISNPPYIARQDFRGLAREISFEPNLALASGIDGLDFYRKIINQAPAYLNNHGLLALEAGINQAGLVKGMLIKGNFSEIKIIKDYNHIDRVLMGRKRG